MKTRRCRGGRDHKLKTVHGTGSTPRRVIFPDCEWSERRRLQIQREDLGKACDETTRNFWPELIVLVGYSYHLAEIRADTGRVYRICRVTEDRVVPVQTVGATLALSLSAGVAKAKVLRGR